MNRLTVLAVFFLSIIYSSEARAAGSAVSFGAPSSTKVKSCDDFATNEFGNPWDMSDTQDVNNFFEGLDINGFSTKNISDGKFFGLTNSNGSYFYLWSPGPCGSYPIGGRWGQNISLDTSKYTRLVVRMYTDTADPYGMRLLWDRGCNYANSRTITAATAIPIKPGWHTYEVDLPSVALDSSSNTTAWGAAPITGFAILPTTQSGANIYIDEVRLIDPTSCASASSSYSYTATQSGNDNRVSIFLDDNGNPFDGYAKQLVSSAAVGSSSASFSDTVGIMPGAYSAVGVVDSDFRTLLTANPWDMDSSYDIQTIGFVTNGTFSNGIFSGVTGSGGSNLYPRIDSGIDSSIYRYFTIKISRSSTASPLRIIWDNGGFIDLTESHNIGNDTYQYDLGSRGGWTGNITTFVVQIQGASVSFSLDFMSLRSLGYDTSRDTSTLASNASISGQAVVVNQPPLVSILEPNKKGGEALQPWNMNSGDFARYINLTDAADSAKPTETLTTFLPDVRYQDGVRGDFFKGTNTSGSDDPTNYSTFPFGVSNPISFDSSVYRDLCFKLNMPLFDLGLGSVARVIWKAQNGDFKTTEDLPLIYDGWGSTRWYEYCLDMGEVYIDGTTSPSWNGTIEAFRVDSHEFSTSKTFYFDYIKLRKDDASTTGKFNIVYDLEDPDDVSSVTLYYSSSATSLGTAITTLSESRESYVYTWDTSAVPNGTYYVHAVATDGYNSTNHYNKARLVVNNTGASGSAPVVSLESPAEGATVCSTVQLKGYALQTDRYEDVASVEASLGNSLFAVITPDKYSPQAKAAYPSADSSNTGFNATYDISSFANGAYTLTLKSYSTDGQITTTTRAITKSSTGCAETVSDPDPSGSPVPVDTDDGSTITKPKFTKLKLTNTGVLSMVLGDFGAASCSLAFHVGTKSTDVSTAVKTITVTNADVEKGKITLEAKGIKPAKSLKTLFFTVTRDCGDGFPSTSGAKKVANKVNGGKAKKIAAVATAIGKKLKKK